MKKITITKEQLSRLEKLRVSALSEGVDIKPKKRSIVITEDQLSRLEELRVSNLYEAESTSCELSDMLQSAGEHDDPLEALIDEFEQCLNQIGEKGRETQKIFSDVLQQLITIRETKFNIGNKDETKEVYNLVRNLFKSFIRTTNKTVRGQYTFASKFLMLLLENVTILSDYLKEINTLVGLTDMEGYDKHKIIYAKLKDSLGDAEDKLSDEFDFKEIKEILEDALERATALEYERSFRTYNFSHGKEIKEKGQESRIHTLNRNDKDNPYDLLDKSIGGDDIGPIMDHIYNNINSFVSNVDNKVTKYDIVSNEDICTEDGSFCLDSGSRVEVKKFKSESASSTDSYYAEFLASVVKTTKTLKTLKRRRNNTPEYGLNRYNAIIQGVYKEINNNKTLQETLLSKLVGTTKGLFLDDRHFIPITHISFYISNKGQNSCTNKRLSVRYRIKDQAPYYILKKDDETGKVW